MKFASPVLATLMLVLAAGNAVADACNTARAVKSPVWDSPGGQWVELKSHLPIEWQARVIGATWLDQQLIDGGSGLGDLGFGSEAKQAIQQRADFLAEQGLAERREQRVILTRNLLGTLRSRELERAAKDIAVEPGLVHRPVTDGQRVAGIYRRSVMLASGRYAMLDDGMGFSLVP